LEWHCIPEAACSSLNVLAGRFALLAAGEIRLFTGHDTAWVDDVQYDKGEEHRGRVKDVLVGFMSGNGRVEALGVFNEAENDTDLFQRLVQEVPQNKHW
jgi:hypothetical protein